MEDMNYNPIEEIQKFASREMTPEQLKSGFQSLAFTKYNVPQFKESPDKKWIKAGQDNLYMQYLVDKLNKSATHNAIVSAKIKQVVGEGLVCEDSEDKDQQAAIKEFLKKIDSNNLLRKIATDQQIFGYFCMGAIWSNDRKKVTNLYHIDASAVRVAKPNDEDEIEGYYYSENWRKYQNPKFCPKFISIYNTGNRIDASQMMMVKKYRPDTRFYGVPEYVSAMNAIELEYELSNYQLNSVKQGFAPSMLVSLNDGAGVTEEQKEVIWKTLNSLYKGSDNAGRFMLTFAQDKEHAPTVTPINANNLNDIYTTMAEFVQEQIIVGHRLTSPMLAGIKTAGDLGGSKELEQASELFFTQVIGPEQIEIEECFNEILRTNGFSLKVYIKDLQPLSYQIEPQEMLKVFTLDEIRKKLGLTPLSKEDRAEIYNRNGIAAETIAPVLPAPGTPVAEAQSAELTPTNEAVRNLTAKQHMQLVRIIRQYSKGQITKEVATVLLKISLGLSDADIAAMLPDTEDEDLNVQAPGVAPYVDEVKKKKLETPSKLV